MNGRTSLSCPRLLVAASVGAGKRWWPVVAGIGVVVSQAVIFIWWEDAATGTVPNLLVIAAVVLADRLGLSSRPPAPRTGASPQP